MFAARLRASSQRSVVVGSALRQGGFTRPSQQFSTLNFGFSHLCSAPLFRLLLGCSGHLRECVMGGLTLRQTVSELFMLEASIEIIHKQVLAAIIHWPFRCCGSRFGVLELIRLISISKLYSTTTAASPP